MNYYIDNISNEELQKYASLGIDTKFPYTTIDEKNDVEISIGIENRILYISFLGSISKKDWLHNFMFWKKPYKRMNKLFFVHSGFLKIYKTCRPVVHTWLQKIDEYDTIILSGHSMGAAIATLCLEDISFIKEEHLIPMRNKTITSIVTASPRVFSIFGSKIVNSRCDSLIRIIYKNDGVPTVPPALFLYKHVGMVKQFGKRGLPWFIFPSSVYHHSIANYRNLTDLSKSNSNNNELYEDSYYMYRNIYAIASWAIISITLSLLILL